MGAWPREQTESFCVSNLINCGEAGAGARGDQSILHLNLINYGEAGAGAQEYAY